VIVDKRWRWWETRVVWLITQRSRVQFLPRYQGQGPFPIMEGASCISFANKFANDLDAGLSSLAGRRSHGMAVTRRSTRRCPGRSSSTLTVLRGLHLDTAALRRFNRSGKDYESMVRLNRTSALSVEP
jgi:hypothetical protein